MSEKIDTEKLRELNSTRELTADNSTPWMVYGSLEIISRVGAVIAVGDGDLDNLDLIVAAVNALPALLDSADERDAENTKLREQIARDELVINLLEPSLEDCKAAYEAAEEEPMSEELINEIAKDMFEKVRNGDWKF